MRPMLSEFSYGYALTEELVSGGTANLTAAPIFPSLYAEGQIGGGWREDSIPGYATISPVQTEPLYDSPGGERAETTWDSILQNAYASFSILGSA